jgi:plasmid stability protein
MPQLILPSLDPATFDRLRQRALEHNRPVEVEAQAILADAVRPAAADPWAAVNAFRERLAASGRTFGDSVELLREDRAR